MTDLSLTIGAKSDQLNADDLMGGPRTITVTDVRSGAAEQPIAIHFEGDNGKPFKPCKTMRRLLVLVWGKDGRAYAGRSMTLFRDPEVAFGGMKVGGARISHMSDISEKKTFALTEKKGQKKPYSVMPLAAAQKTATQPEFNPDAFVDLVTEKAATATDAEALNTWWDSPEITESRKRLANGDQEKSATVRGIIADRKAALGGGEI